MATAQSHTAQRSNRAVFEQIKTRTMNKMASRRRIGPFDWSRDSWDSKTAAARAYRIVCRLRGERISARQAMWG